MNFIANSISLNYININGKLISAAEAGIPHDSRAFRYGYGIFETMLVKDAAIQLESYHWERLFAGAAALHFDLPKLLTPQLLQTEVLHTVQKNKLEKLSRVRLQLYAGTGGLYDGKDQKPNYLIECFPLDEHIIELNEIGLGVGIATGLQKSINSLANLKSCNALIYALAARQAKENKWNDALILNTQGNIIESTIANIFWIKDQQTFTPPLSEGCVAGVMRRRLLELLPQVGYTVTEQPLTKELLMQADELFLTNAIRRLKWVKQLENKSFTNAAIRSIFKKISGIL